MQRCYQTRCCPAAEGRRSAPAQEPIPARRLGGGVPGALSRQDPTSVPWNHQAQPGAVLACLIEMTRLTQLHNVSMLLSIHKHGLALGAIFTTNRNLLLCLEMARTSCSSERTLWGDNLLGMMHNNYDATWAVSSEWGLWYLRASIDSVAFQ